MRWVVDPLDGTTNYLYGFPGFNVSIAAEVDGAGRGRASCYDVVRDELFSATRGGGATRDGAPIRRVGAPTDLAHALVGTGFSYDAERRRRQAEVLVDVLPRVRDIRRFRAPPPSTCARWPADGSTRYYERGLAPWDLAAGGPDRDRGGRRRHRLRRRPGRRRRGRRGRARASPTRLPRAPAPTTGARPTRLTPSAMAPIAAARWRPGL